MVLNEMGNPKVNGWRAFEYQNNRIIHIHAQHFNTRSMDRVRGRALIVAANKWRTFQFKYSTFTRSLQARQASRRYKETKA